MHKYDLALVGCGNMGAALISGYLRDRPDRSVLIVDPNENDARGPMASERVVRSTSLLPLYTDTARLTVLAVKPQSFPTLLSALAKTTSASGLVLSIAAGVASDTLRRDLPDARLVRCMPNTPAMVGAGTSVLWCGPEVGDADREACNSLFLSVGTAEWVPEEPLVDAATAISGSGPAYVFAFAEALAKAGTAVGLEPDLAARLAVGTIVGAAAMLGREEASPARLKAAVCSPAGTTDAALKIFETERKLDDLVRHAAQAAHRRAIELRGPLN